MGIPVIVDSDDLETLLFATGVVRAMEAAVHAVKGDEQFRMAKPMIAAAHDRVANAWRGATRKRDMPEIYREPTKGEVEELVMLADAGADREDGMEVEKPHLYQRFVGMGLVEIGIHDERIQWNVGSGQVWSARSPLQRMKLTERGREFLPPAPLLPVDDGDLPAVAESVKLLDRLRGLLRR